MDPAATQALIAFLLKAFSPDELRLLLFTLPSGENIEQTIAWNNAPNRVTYELIAALKRRGLINQAFFQALSAERPFRQAEIDTVALMSGVGTASAKDIGEPIDTDPLNTPPTARPTRSIHQIFRTSGFPDISFVEPSQLPDIKAHLRFLGEGLVVEGASGVGKTTAVRHALSSVLGADLDALESSKQLIWLSSKSPQDQQRLAGILSAGERALRGHLVIDDFHWLPTSTQDQVAALVKLIADASRDVAKVVLIGINPIGESLVRSFRDLAGRFHVVSMNRQPDDKIEELIRRGEEAANIVFDKRALIVDSARRSFYTAQLLCQNIALIEGIHETLPEKRHLVTSPLEAVNRVRDRLKFKYHAQLIAFASYDAAPPPRGATLALLWLLAQNFDSGVSLAQARLRFSALRTAIEWLMESNLQGLFDRDPGMSALLFYNRDAGILSTEDPQLDFYLNNLSWPALARDSGHSGIEWLPDSTPIFSARPTEPLVHTPEPSAFPPRQLPRSRVLHLSDLHITTTRSALQLYDQLREDLHGELEVRSLDAVVVSGDIVNRGTRAEYLNAAHLFRELKRGFSLGPQQLVMVPGNHDLDWSISRTAYRAQRREDWSGPSEEHWHAEDGRLIEVARLQDLQPRFQAFSEFYHDICSSPYPLDPESQATLSHFPGANLLFLGLNSSWAIDHLHTDRADINARALGRALERIDREPAYRGCLRIAVWHHPVSSADEDRIRDSGFLERLARSGFRLALHGHIHKAAENHYRYDISAGGRRLDLLGAGSFGAPVKAWSPGFPLQYQLLEFANGELTVHTRRREEVNGAWKPDARWTTGRGRDPLPRYTLSL